VIVGIVRPGTGDPVAEGEVGELVVTTLNPDYPLIRFGTGDLSAVLPGTCPSGRTNTRIKGWMGRADQAAKVRGTVQRLSASQPAQRRQGDRGGTQLQVRGGGKGVALSSFRNMYRCDRILN
jgi:phenylacetate-CoA ligase